MLLEAGEADLQIIFYAFSPSSLSAYVLNFFNCIIIKLGKEIDVGFLYRISLACCKIGCFINYLVTSWFNVYTVLSVMRAYKNPSYPCICFTW